MSAFQVRHVIEEFKIDGIHKRLKWRPADVQHFSQLKADLSTSDELGTVCISLASMYVLYLQKADHADSYTGGLGKLTLRQQP